MDEGSRAMNIIDRIGNKQIEKVLGQRQLPEFAPGDTLRVDVKVVEGTRERIQAFEGVCIARKSNGVNSSFTVRKISYGEGVERVFPIHAPQVAGVTVMRRGRFAVPSYIICEVGLVRQHVLLKKQPIARRHLLKLPDRPCEMTSSPAAIRRMLCRLQNFI